MATARATRGLSQQQVADVAQIEPETLSRAETGALSLSLSNLARVAQALGVGLKDLVDVADALPTTELSKQETEVLAMLRGMDARGRAHAIALVRQAWRAWPEVQLAAEPAPERRRGSK